MKRLMMTALTILLIGALVACSSAAPKNNNSSNTPPPANTNQDKSGDKTAEEPPKVYKVSHIQGTWGSPVPGPGTAGVKLINEKFNVDYTPQFVPYGEYDSILPVTMAAGDLPDIIGMEGVSANFVKWAKQGAFLPLNDYIDKYETFKVIPQNVWDGVSLDGKIYAIPFYFPAKYGKKPLIRQDWLDNLGLKMPTNYDELVEVAIAFTKDDPDKNGQNDTYGYGLAKRIVYGAWMGAYWDGGWYHTNGQGQLIPGNISIGQKEQLEVLNRMYEAGAIHKDWALSNSPDVRKDFFSGKIGIWYEQPYDFSISRFQTLKDLQPEAEIAVIPPFEQPDGEQGFIGLSGYYELVALNSDLAKEPGKIERILEMYDYFMKFIPVDERNPSNEQFDWTGGYEGVGYEMVNGAAVETPETRDLAPKTYISSRYWVESDEMNEIEKVHTNEFARSFVENAVSVLNNSKIYIDPVNRIHSEVKAANESELNLFLEEHFTRMIVGQDPIANFDKVVEEYLKKGGQEMIDDVNRILNEQGITGEWR